jgi:hypothetical protein
MHRRGHHPRCAVRDDDRLLERLPRPYASTLRGPRMHPRVVRFAAMNAYRLLWTTTESGSRVLITRFSRPVVVPLRPSSAAAIYCVRERILGRRSKWCGPERALVSKFYPDRWPSLSSKTVACMWPASGPWQRIVCRVPNCGFALGADKELLRRPRSVRIRILRLSHECPRRL